MSGSKAFFKAVDATSRALKATGRGIAKAVKATGRGIAKSTIAAGHAFWATQGLAKDMPAAASVEAGRNDNKSPHKITRAIEKSINAAGHGVAKAAKATGHGLATAFNWASGNAALEKRDLGRDNFDSYVPKAVVNMVFSYASTMTALITLAPVIGPLAIPAAGG